MKVQHIINEHTSAGIVYGMNKSCGEFNVPVFNFGGRTFDITLLTIDQGFFELFSTNRDTHLSSENFDQRAKQFFVRMMKKNSNVDISSDKRTQQTHCKEIECFKCALSSQ